MTTTTAQSEALDPQQLLDLVVRQRDLYKTLGQLATQQHDLIESGETPKLLSLLTRRQTLLDQLKTIAEAIRPYRAAWDDVRAKLSQPHRDELRALLDETDNLMRDIMARDRADGDSLQQARGKVTAKLGRSGIASQAARAYQGAAAAQPPSSTLPPSSRFTDRQG
ncbi:flagellar export chaperone FlgN [Mucisphaera sp.]|uniref:flagellar export chaperone FlgN n=1 Tax=Mucisphaera sp. TaxID=2913024 RepID=UPI003D0A4B3F